MLRLPPDQELSKVDRGRVLDMFKNVVNDINKHYYDTNFHGIDWQAKVHETQNLIN